MKVSPRHNSIVSASIPQTIVRHFVLAAAAYVSVLCGAASAQSAPAAPPLFEGNGAELSYEIAPGNVATLESSGDLLLWQPVVPADFAEEILHYAAVPGTKGYFRLRVDATPAVGKSRWDLENARLVRNTAGGAEVMLFSSGGSGLLQSPAGNAGFTWVWTRTGADTGSAVLTWSDGTVEEMEFQFTASNSGVFTSERSKDGIPDGAVTGTFRDDPTAVLTVSMPPESESRAITLGGTGRPVRINLDGTGNASITSPAGGVSYIAAYSPTGTTSARLVLTCLDGVTQTCDLQFSGPACGSYTLRVDSPTGLRRTAGGAFTVEAQ